MKKRGFGIVLLAMASFAVSTVGYAQDGGLDNVFKMPRPEPAKQPEPTQQPTSLDIYEFNGIMNFGGVLRVSVYDTKDKKNYWLKEGEVAKNGIVVQRFDATNEAIVLSQGGTMKKLSLKQVKIESIRIPPPQTTVAQTAEAVGAAAVDRPMQSQVETDEEARARIQRVAEEIRRRRAERRARLEERRQTPTN